MSILPGGLLLDLDDLSAVAESQEWEGWPRGGEGYTGTGNTRLFSEMLDPE